MKKLNLIAINQQNAELLSPLLRDPALLLAAGLKFSPAMGLLGIQLLASHEQLFAIAVHQQTVGKLLLGHRYGHEGEILPDQWEIGYAVLPEFQNRGIATAAVRQVIAKFAGRCQTVTITADIKEDNCASQAVVRHAGFSLRSCQNGIQHWQMVCK